jgi:hypothetical protein
MILEMQVSKEKNFRRTAIYIWVRDSKVLSENPQMLSFNMLSCFKRAARYILLVITAIWAIVSCR